MSEPHNIYCIKIAKRYNLRVDWRKEKIPNIENKFVVAQDKDDNRKMFYSTSDINSFLCFLNDSKDRYLYETIHKDIVKLYFDFDEDRVSDISIFINDFLKKLNSVEFSTYENDKITITKDDLLVYIRKTEPISSIHIIIPKYSMSKSNLNFIVNHYFNTLPVKADNSLYHSSKFLNLKFNNKYVKKEKPILTDLNNSPSIQYDDIITYIKNTTTITIPKRKKIGDYFDNINSSPITDCSQEDNLKDIVQSIIVSRFTIIHHLLHLPKSFFNSKDWKIITINLFFHNCLGLKQWLTKSITVSENEAYSLEKNEQVIKDADETFKTYKFQKLLDKINNEYNTNYIYEESTIDFEPKYLEWISKTTKIPREQLENIINDNLGSNQSNSIVLNSNTTLFIKTRQLHIIGQPILSFWWDCEYLPIGVNGNILSTLDDKEDYFKEFDTTTMTNAALKFIENDKDKLLGVRLLWGGGKTYRIINPIVKKIMDTTKFKTLFITESNPLNDEITKYYRNLFPDYYKIDGETKKKTPIKIVQSHINNGKFSLNNRIFVCSLESLYKTDGFDFDIIILDEFESIFRHTESRTMWEHNPTENPTTCFNRIEKLIGNAKKVISADADHSKKRLEPICIRCKIPMNKVNLYYSNETKYRNYKYRVIPEGDVFYFTNTIVNAIYNNQKVVIGSLSITYLTTLKEILFDRFVRPFEDGSDLPIPLDVNGEPMKLKKILFKSSEEYTVNNTLVDKTRSLNEVIKENDIDIFAYTPSIRTGVSINLEEIGGTPRFHLTFMLITSMSCPVAEAFQMIYRVRDLRLEKIIICIPKIKNKKKITENEQIILRQNRLIHASKKMNKMKTLETDTYNSLSIEDEDPHINLNPLYKIYKLINTKEILESYYNTAHEVLNKLINVYKFPDVKIIVSPADEKNSEALELMKVELENADKKVREQKAKRLVLTKLLPDKFKSIKEEEEWKRACKDDRKIRPKKNLLDTIGLVSKKPKYKIYGNRWLNKKKYNHTTTDANADEETGVFSLNKLPTIFSVNGSETKPKKIARADILVDNTYFTPIPDYFTNTEETIKDTEDVNIQPKNYFFKPTPIISIKSITDNYNSIGIFKDEDKEPTDIHIKKRKYNSKITIDKNTIYEFIHNKQMLFMFLLSKKNIKIDYINKFTQHLLISDDLTPLSIEETEDEENYTTIQSIDKLKNYQWPEKMIEIFFPFLIDKAPRRLIYKPIKLDRKDFYKSVNKNLDLIKNHFNWWYNTLNMSEDETKFTEDFNLENEKELNNLFKWLQKILSRLGIDFNKPKTSPHPNKPYEYTLTPKNLIYKPTILSKKYNDVIRIKLKVDNSTKKNIPLENIVNCFTNGIYDSLEYNETEKNFIIEQSKNPISVLTSKNRCKLISINNKKKIENYHLIYKVIDASGNHIKKVIKLYQSGQRNSKDGTIQISNYRFNRKNRLNNLSNRKSLVDIPIELQRRDIDTEEQPKQIEIINKLKDTNYIISCYGKFLENTKHFHRYRLYEDNDKFIQAACNKYTIVEEKTEDEMKKDMNKNTYELYMLDTESDDEDIYDSTVEIIDYEKIKADKDEFNKLI